MGGGVQQRNRREEPKERKDPSLSKYGTNMFDTHILTRLLAIHLGRSGLEPSCFVHLLLSGLSRLCLMFDDCILK